MSTKFYFWGDDDSLHKVEDVGRFSLLLGSDTYDMINMERAQIRMSVSGQSTSPQTEECGADHICKIQDVTPQLRNTKTKISLTTR